MQLIQGPLAAVLSLSLVAGTTPGAAQEPPGNAGAPRAPARPAYRGQMQGDQRILHALDRFTFGLRPGDLDAVKAEGLDAWFEQQLHPQSIDNTALQVRLAQFPAMQWSVEDLLYRLPSNAVIRQVIDGKAPMPENVVLQAVYENEAARVTAKKQGGTGQGSGPGNASAAGTPQMERIQERAGGEAADENAMSAAAVPAQVDLGTMMAELTGLPPAERVRRLVAMDQPALDGFLRALKPPQRVELVAGMTPEQKLTVQALAGPERAVTEELMAERLTRDIYSNTQLEEVMTDFWLNHFNVYLRKNEATPYYLVSYERDVIRPRALGKFEDLLEAVAHSPAMLLYLDNAESIGPDSIAAQRAKTAEARGFDRKKKAPEGLNENYARELMELHTLGVNGGYTQADVIQAARILTGWTVEKPVRGGGFMFDERRHEPGTKKVMGQKFKEKGEREGEELLHFLATRPATARFISRKLAVRFVSDDPPQALVERMAQAYLKSGGDIATVLRTMYRSPEFWEQDVYRAKVKTPLEYVLSAARASDAEIENMQPLIAVLRQMGMPLYGCVPPTGYKWEAADWVSAGALVDRMNFALTLTANRLPGIRTAWSQNAVANEGMPPALRLLDNLDSDGSASASQPAVETTSGAVSAPESEEARLESRLVAGGVSATTRSAVLQQFEQQNASTTAAAVRKPPAVERQDQLLAGLLLGSPEFQRR